MLCSELQTHSTYVYAQRWHYPLPQSSARRLEFELTNDRCLCWRAFGLREDQLRSCEAGWLQPGSEVSAMLTRGANMYRIATCRDDYPPSAATPPCQWRYSLAHGLPERLRQWVRFRTELPPETGTKL